jgi:hypothetical protein
MMTTAAATIHPAMTEPTDLDDRLAKLAARRAAARPAETAPAAKRRGHKARIGRVLAAGMSSSAFFSIVGVLAANATTTKSSTVATALPQVPISGPLATSASSTTRTTVVVKVVHHERYVDTNGNTVAPPNMNRATVASAPSSGGNAGTTHSTTGAPVTSGHTPSGGGGGTAPAPTPTPAPTPPPTHSPAPTPPPTTPVTTPKPPSPPPTPPCTGSKCHH